jgi:hypothetical protein
LRVRCLRRLRRRNPRRLRHQWLVGAAGRHDEPKGTEQSHGRQHCESSVSGSPRLRRLLVRVVHRHDHEGVDLIPIRDLPRKCRLFVVVALPIA